MIEEPGSFFGMRNDWQGSNIGLFSSKLGAVSYTFRSDDRKSAGRAAPHMTPNGLHRAILGIPQLTATRLHEFRSIAECESTGPRSKD
jgi:hypothetical protein